MNLHLSTKRKPIESSEILSGTSYFQFQGASFSSSSKGFVKKSPLFTPLFLWKKVSRLLKKASLRSHFSDNFGHWKVSSEKGGPLGVLQNTGSFTEATPPKQSPRNIEKLETPESHLPTSRLQRTHILRKMSWREGMSIWETETHCKFWWQGVKVMKSYDFWYDAFLMCIWMADLIDILLESNLGPFKL